MDPQSIKANLIEALRRLAADAGQQREYLNRIHTPGSSDELALEYYDLILMVPELVDGGELTVSQAEALQLVDDLLGSFSGRGHSALWDPALLDTAKEWDDVRRAARAALSALAAS